jgi:tetratricopeptide (TPR) repeat protein
MAIYLAIGGTILGLGVFATVFGLMLAGKPPDFERELSAGIQKLKRAMTPEVRRLALSIELKDLKSKSAEAKWELIVGAVALEDSEKSAVRERAIALAEDAYKHLEASQKIGFPRGFDGLGNFLLGKVLYQLFRWPEAIEPLEIAATQWPAGRADALSLLVDIDLATEDISPEVVKDRLDYWDGLVGLTPEERERAQLKRIVSKIAFAEYPAAIEMSNAFPKDSVHFPNAMYQQALAKFLNLSAAENESQDPNRASMLQDVYKQMKSVAKDLTLDPVSERRNQYYSGIVLQSLGRWEESISLLSVLRQSSPHTVEGLAGSIAEMKALIKLQRYDEIIVTIRQLFEQFGKLEWYNNAWQPIALLRTGINEIGQDLLVGRAYPQVVEYAVKMPPFCERQDRLRLLSVGYGRWANSLKGKTVADETDALDIRTSLEGVLRAEPALLSTATAPDEGQRFWQKLFYESAKSYEELAMLQMRSPEYFDLIWQAIKNYQSAGDLKQCNVVIDNTLPFEEVDQRPRAYLMKAENLFALNKPDGSLLELEKCIRDHSSHPLAYQSRLNAARMLAERSDFQKSQDYLEQNLYDSSLNPQSAVWKESLFELGRNFYQQGELEFSSAELLKEKSEPTNEETLSEILERANALFTKSIDRLGEWLKRYPDDKRRFETLYSIGKAYQMAAQYPEYLIKDGRPSSADVKRQRLAQYRNLVKNARSTFEQIRMGMNDIELGLIPSSSLRSLLRNSYFAEADLTFQLQDFETALTLYRSVANRFLGEPESLEALTQAAECLKKLGRNEEGIRVIAQAQEILSQIPASQDAKFVSVTRFSRQQWSDLLTRMEKAIY